MFAPFAFKIKVSILEMIQWKYQLTKQTWPVWEQGTIQQAKTIKLYLSTRKITSHRKTLNLHITSPYTEGTLNVLLLPLFLHDSFVRKLHTLALAWDISRFSWLTSYLLVIELTVELDEDELKLPCFTCFGCFSWRLSRLSSSEVQNWTCRS